MDCLHFKDRYRCPVCDVIQCKACNTTYAKSRITCRKYIMCSDCLAKGYSPVACFKCKNNTICTKWRCTKCCEYFCIGYCSYNHKC